MPHRLVRIFAEEPAEPAHPFALDDWSASIRRRRSGMLAMWPPMTIVACGRYCRTNSHIFFTLSTLGMIDEMPTTSYWPRADLLDEAIERGEVQQRARRLDVRLDDHQAPTAMEHPQREGALVRVTWLWYSSIGFMRRLPYSSSWP